LDVQGILGMNGEMVLQMGFDQARLQGTDAHPNNEDLRWVQRGVWGKLGYEP
jgi:hypothetical protein